MNKGMADPLHVISTLCIGRIISIEQGGWWSAGMAVDRMGLSRGMTCSDSRIYLVPSALNSQPLVHSHQQMAAP
jgi:hypothetical protein